MTKGVVIYNSMKALNRWFVAYFYHCFLTNQLRRARLCLFSACLLCGLGVAPNSLQAAATDYTFSTLAGTPGGAAAVDALGSAARFAYPSGIAVDAAGNVYVGDTQNHTIRKITPAGAVTTLAGSSWPGSIDGTGEGAGFDGPAGVAVDSAGNLYVADLYKGTIRKVTPAGTVTTLAGAAGSSGAVDGVGSAARFNIPIGVTTDTAGNIYVADQSNHTIRKITPAGIVTTLAGSAGSSGANDGAGSAARFNQPSGVTVDNIGCIYVADMGNHTIRKITPAGTVTTLAGLARSYGSVDATGSAARFNQPSGLAVDNVGCVYVADTGNHTIRKLTSAGLVTTVAGFAGSSNCVDGVGTVARFHSPSAVAVDGAGNIYAADAGNCVIRKITSAGEVTTMAGSPILWGSADGAGMAARFNFPCAVAADNAGCLYVADNHNRTVRKITSTGGTSTIAGLAGAVGVSDGTGSEARFFHPQAVAVDYVTNIYVADADACTIRKITPAGAVTTLAGLAANSGFSDGTGSAARFYQPSGLAVDSAGNIFVADTYNHTIRKVTPAGVVTTFVGASCYQGTNDGVGTAARFNYPLALAIDSSGNLYVADSQNYTIRKVKPTGQVLTLAGLAGHFGLNDGTGSGARFSSLSGVAVDNTGNLFVADGNAVRKVTALGVVTSLTQFGNYGATDGTGSIVRFGAPFGIGIDGAGNLYIADSYNNLIRKGVPACADRPTIDQTQAPVGQLRQLDTTPQTATNWAWRLVRQPSSSTAQLSSASIRNPIFIPDVPDLFVFELQATDATGRVSISQVSLCAVAPPTITTSPLDQTAALADTVTLAVAVTGSSPFYYQWRKNAQSIAGATNSALILANIHRPDAGSYSVIVSNFFGSLPSSNALLRVLVPQQAGAPQILPDQTFQFGFGDSDGNPLTLSNAANFQIQASTNLADWIPLTNSLSLSNGQLILRDPDSTNTPNRFYRVIEQ